MKKLVLHGICAITLVLTGLAYAAEEAAPAPAAPEAAAPEAAAPEAAKPVEQEKPVDVVVTGDNYCLLAAFGGEQAKPAPNAENFKNALKVATVTDAAGKEVADLAGKTLHYLPTETSQPLIAGEENAGKTVTVTGKLYKDAGVLVVEKFEVTASEEDDWAPLPTGTLSGQQVL
ncbi:MAG: hypothetical protein HYV26_24080 [Candidatus Hydrogenedentes bacterium]|nr:hypothetical protein [Candidatus Hydrogenedentota bacterium]